MGKGPVGRGLMVRQRKREEDEMTQNAFYTCMELSKNKGN